MPDNSRTMQNETRVGLSQTGVLETAYMAMVEQDHISLDPAQIPTLRELQRLLHEIASYSPQKQAPKQQSFVKKLFSPTADEPIVKQPQGLYIYGDVGRGKSMLMDLFFDYCEHPKKRRVHFHAFMLEVHGFMHQWREGNEGDPIAPLSQRISESATLLCFDEFHVTDIADAMILSRLFEALYEAGTIVVATSNRHPDDLYKNGLQRQRFLPFIELIKERNAVLELAAEKDYRLVHMRALETTYYTPLGTDATAFIKQSFEELTQQTEMESATLIVNAREIHLPAAHGDIAMAGFSDLCERPLGTADYLKIACDFGFMIVYDIPRLTIDKLNEAKRFVTLIDALYEHKVKLICTAETPPDQLYTEGKGAFEFERTVSRLIEMQTERYWKDAHVSD